MWYDGHMNKERRRAAPRTVNGQRYGALTITDSGPLYSGDKRYQKKVMARCDCGFERLFDEWQVFNGKVVSCPDCSLKRRSEALSNIESGWVGLRQQYIGNAIKRGISFNLSVEEVRKIAENNCIYCSAEPVEKKFRRHSIRANGIDRLDSRLGYSIENCVPCCFDCNKLKADRTVLELYNKMKVVTAAIEEFGLLK